jgi:hypothetical protein
MRPLLNYRSSMTCTPRATAARPAEACCPPAPERTGGLTDGHTVNGVSVTATTYEN